MKRYRKHFNLLKDNKLIYFDNAATSLKPDCVIEAITNYYKNYSVNIHRGNYKLSQKASIVYEETHEKVSKFIGSKPNEVIFTSNSTDSLNQVMYMLYNSNYFKKNDEIILPISEHHANLVPWQFLAKKLNLKLRFVDITEDYNLDINKLYKIINKKTKLITLAHVSNTIGTINSISEIGKICKEKNILFCVDGSQSVPHLKYNFKKSNIDFLCFTGHKMLAPTGIGCLIGKEKLLEKFEPVRYGGDMISDVTLSKSSWNNLPYKFEAGTPNIAGAYGLNEAISFIEKIGLENIHNYEIKLLTYLIKRLKEIKNIDIYNIQKPKKQAPMIIFNLKNIKPRELSTLLDRFSNISTRAGFLCAQPIVSKYSKDGVVRVSLYFYNTYEEIDVFIETLKKISQF